MTGREVVKHVGQGVGIMVDNGTSRFSITPELIASIADAPGT